MVPSPGLQLSRAVLASNGGGELYVDTLTNKRARTVPLVPMVVPIVDRWSTGKARVNGSSARQRAVRCGKPTGSGRSAGVTRKRRLGGPSCAFTICATRRLRCGWHLALIRNVVQRVLWHATAAITMDLAARSSESWPTPACAGASSWPLTACRIDLARCRIEVVEAITEVHGRVVVGTTKTHQRRSVPDRRRPQLTCSYRMQVLFCTGRWGGAVLTKSGEHAAKDSAASACSGPARARVSTRSFSIGVTAQTHLVVLMGFRVLPIIPIVQAKATLPRFGHTQSVLPA